ncbi:hypothetical protein Tco_0787809, partial [Tanacetum coccineum]
VLKEWRDVFKDSWKFKGSRWSRLEDVKVLKEWRDVFKDSWKFKGSRWSRLEDVKAPVVAV